MLGDKPVSFKTHWNEITYSKTIHQEVLLVWPLPNLMASDTILNVNLMAKTLRHDLMYMWQYQQSSWRGTVKLMTRVQFPFGTGLWRWVTVWRGLYPLMLETWYLLGVAWPHNRWLLHWLSVGACRMSKQPSASRGALTSCWCPGCAQTHGP